MEPAGKKKAEMCGDRWKDRNLLMFLIYTPVFTASLASKSEGKTLRAIHPGGAIIFFDYCKYPGHQLSLWRAPVVVASFRRPGSACECSQRSGTPAGDHRGTNKSPGRGGTAKCGLLSSWRSWRVRRHSLLRMGCPTSYGNIVPEH